MKNKLASTAAMFAAAVLTGFGMQGCGDDAAQQLLLLLGLEEGPNKAEMLGIFQTPCDIDNGFTIECDGDIEEPLAGGAKDNPIDADDDLFAMMLAIGTLVGNLDALETLEQNFQDLANEQFPEGIESGETGTFGPVTGVIDLSEACAPGTGALSYTHTETWANEMDLGARGDDPGVAIAWQTTYVLSLNNCAVEGEIDDDAGNDLFVMNGTMTVVDEENEDGSYLNSFSGGGQINPGAVATGEAAEPIWGASEVMALSASDAGTFDDGLGDDFEGGICYGGTDASSDEACGAYFVPASDIIPVLFDY